MIKCNICGANVKVHRVDDGETEIIITGDDSFDETICISNGYTEVRCTADDSHIVSPEVENDAIDFYEECY